jgi:propanediol utilization protein
VIIGHSERREMYGETDADVNAKVLAALDAGLIPIMCCGETLQQREAGITAEHITMQIKLGLKNVPVRESGDVAGTPGLKMVGPAGEIDVAEGAIIAKRHIHMTPADAEGLGVSNGEVVKVLVKSERTTIYDDVVVRVSPSYALAMHIDTDECNAAAAFGEVYGEIVHD